MRRRWLGKVAGAVGVLVGLAGCGPTPEAMQQGLDPQTVRTIGTLDIGPWQPSPARFPSLTLIEGRNGAGELEQRAFLTPASGEPVLVGTLAQQFPDVPLATVTFELAGGRFIAGLVLPQVPGDLSTVQFERVEPNQAEWMKALKASNVNRRTFVVPIAPEEYQQWERIQRIAITTRESLQRGVDNPATSGYAVEQIYNPALDVRKLFTVIK